jgi:hypothetical protein
MNFDCGEKYEILIGVISQYIIWNGLIRTAVVFFSSPELKAQVSFSDRPLSGVHLSVRL